MITPPSRSYRWLFWSLALVGLTLDQASKYFVFGWLHDVPEQKAAIIPGAFYAEARYTGAEQRDDWAKPLRTLTHQALPCVNKGALWGIGGRVSDEPGSDYNHVFAFISIVAALAIMLWSFRRKSAQQWFLCTALGLILAGTVGNLYDRVVFEGVRDFLHWNRWFDWPVFNIADCCLVCGAGLLLLQAVFAPTSQAKQGSVQEPALNLPPAQVEHAIQADVHAGG